ncbi:MAG: hypothetical protein U9N61_02105 [Euryarchaeota archaeon]|nr:hypothetical protein [Euryarchaeota archaeon]
MTEEGGVIVVKTNAAFVTLNDTYTDEGTKVTGKVFVDGTYLRAYTPEVLKFCDGCQCGRYADAKADCSLGTHEILIDGTKEGKYTPWVFNHTFKAGEVFTFDPVLLTTPPVDVNGTIYLQSSEIPREMLVGTLTIFSIDTENQTDADVTVRFRVQTEFTNVSDPTSTYLFMSDWTDFENDERKLIDVPITLPSKAIPQGMTTARYTIIARLEVV